MHLTVFFQGATPQLSFLRDLINDQNLFCLLGLWSDSGSPRSIMFSTCFQYAWRSALCTLAFICLKWEISLARWVASCLLKSLFLFLCSALTCLSIHGLCTLFPRSCFWGIYFSISSCILPLNLVHNVSKSSELDIFWNSVAYSLSSDLNPS